MDTCVYVAESLCCPPETITTLLINYIPIQNNKSKPFFLLTFIASGNFKVGKYSQGKKKLRFHVNYWVIKYISGLGRK